MVAKPTCRSKHFAPAVLAITAIPRRIPESGKAVNLGWYYFK